MNPMNFLKYKKLIETFRDNHPKFPLFLKAASQKIGEGSVVEIKLRDPDGQEKSQILWSTAMIWSC